MQKRFIITSIFAGLLIAIVFIVIFRNKKNENTDFNNAEYNIEIKERDINTIAKLSELIDSIEYIPLETSKNCLIGKVTKIKCFGDKLYIYDEPAQTILLYNINGKFISKYDKLGRGPFEYTNLNDFDIDPEGNCYLLETKKIIKLDSNLNPVREIQLPFGSLRFAIHNENIALLHFGTEDEVHILTSDGKKIASYFPYWETERTVDLKPLIKFESVLLYKPINKDNIYRISSDTVSLHTNIIFEKPLPEDFWVENNELYNYPNLYMNGVYVYCENESSIFFRFDYDHNGYDGPNYVLHSKNSGKTIIYTNEIENDCYLSKYPPFISEVTNDGRFVATIDAGFFSESMKNSPDLFISKVEVTEMSNPVIAFIKFKDL